MFFSTWVIIIGSRFETDVQFLKCVFVIRWENDKKFMKSRFSAQGSH